MISFDFVLLFAAICFVGIPLGAFFYAIWGRE